MSKNKYLYMNTDTDTDSGLFKSQVLTLLDNKPRELDLSIVNICNVNRWFKRDRNLVNLAGFPMRYANTLWGLALLLISSFFVAVQTLIHFRSYDVIIARGYYGGLIGLFLTFWGKTFIWDPRSVYPLEMLGKGYFKRKSYSFKFWCWLEAVLLKRSAGVLVVSLGHKKYLNRLYKVYKHEGQASKIQIVPCYASPVATNVAVNEFSDFQKQSDETAPIVCYMGSLDNGWNNIDLYVDIFKNILNAGARLVVMTHSTSGSHLKQRLNDVDIEVLDRALLVLKVDDVDAQMGILNQCDYGLMYMKKVPDWFTRISVKFAMYRCAGLPVITNRYFGGALDVIRCQNDSESIIISESEQSYKRLKRTSNDFRRKLTLSSESLFSTGNFFRALKRIIK